MKKTESTLKTKKVGRLAENLQGRLVYMAIKCPLVNGGKCGVVSQQREAVPGQAAGKDNKVKRPPRAYAPDELVTLHVALPYELRRQALEACLNCSALLRSALRHRLRNLQNE